MNLRQSKLLVLLSCCLLLASGRAAAQFTITEDFRGSGSPDIIIGDNAKLTSGQEDPVGAGWLRLTSDAGNQKGYAYINKSFPSTLGVIIDFEYLMWRTRADNTYKGADGLSIFLFDANYGPGTFHLGAYGGSLGYANNTDATPKTAGLTGGYLGIGLDAYGNFVRKSEGKNGGSTDLSPNSIAFRGPTTDNNPSSTTTNEYMKGITIHNNSIFDALSNPPKGDPTEDVIDYNTVTAKRPDKSTFYRRVQIKIEPISGGRYVSTILWTTSFGGSMVELMKDTTTVPPPPLLKIGFAASTGGGFNNHEIRNLLVTTLGNLRITKRADVDVLRSIPATTGPSNKITYSLDVTNDNPADLDGIIFKDSLTDGNGHLIPSGMFKITSIAYSGFKSGTILSSASSSSPIINGKISGTLKLAAHQTGTITVKGELTGTIPALNLLGNTATVTPTTILDEDMTNNTASTLTPVVSEKTDLVVNSTVDANCQNVATGNTFTLKVSNIGVLDLTYGQQTANKLTVSFPVPAGATPSNYGSNSGWNGNYNFGTHMLTFTKNGSSGTLSSGQSLPVIAFKLTSNSSYSDSVRVHSDVEPVENQGNNAAAITMNPVPANPGVVADTIFYCQDETPVALSATADAGNTLLWSLNEGGVSITTPYIPATQTPGETVYYVQQKAPSGCLSDYTPITVNVLTTPTPGGISGDQLICTGSVPTQITGTNAGTGEGTVAYQWQTSEDESSWATIAGASAENYQPGSLPAETYFQRITVATKNGKSCVSNPSAIVDIKTKNCYFITNPMIYQKVKK